MIDAKGRLRGCLRESLAERVVACSLRNENTSVVYAVFPSEGPALHISTPAVTFGNVFLSFFFAEG